MSKLRLLKVIVRPVFVLEEDASLSEVVADPIMVTAQDWPSYSAEKFPEAFKSLRAQIEGPELEEVSE